MKINPTIKELLEDEKDLTLLSLSWAIAWRSFAFYMLFCFAVGFFYGMLS